MSTYITGDGDDVVTGSRTLPGYLWKPVSESVARSFRED